MNTTLNSTGANVLTQNSKIHTIIQQKQFVRVMAEHPVTFQYMEKSDLEVQNKSIGWDWMWVAGNCGHSVPIDVQG